MDRLYHQVVRKRRVSEIRHDICPQWHLFFLPHQDAYCIENQYPLFV